MMVHVHDERIHGLVSAGLVVFGFGVFQFLLLYGVSGQRFSQDFHERAIAAEIDGQAAVFIGLLVFALFKEIDGDIQPDQRFPGAGNARDKADALLAFLLGFFDNLQNGFGCFSVRSSEVWLVISAMDLLARFFLRYKVVAACTMVGVGL